MELLIVVTIIGVLASISASRMVRAKMSAEETSAVASLRNINSGQATFSSSCAGGHYAIDLADLVQPPSGSTAAFISPDLASNGIQKGGYAFALARSGDSGTTDSPAPACNGGSTPASNYHAAADRVGYAGARYFATDKSGTVFEERTGPLANPIPTTATVFR